MESKGKITHILQPTSGQTKGGKDWIKMSFVIDTGTQYDNLNAFEVFGSERVANLETFKVGDEVVVSFGIKTNEWQGKYFTTLNCTNIL